MSEPRHLRDDQQGQPPLRARLHRYALTTAEFALLTAMCEHCSDGSVIKASVPRLAAYAKLSTKQVDRLIDGYDEPRTNTRVPGLKERGILTELSPYSAGRRMPAIYRINEDALQLDPRMRPWLNKQAQRLLPGILKPPKTTTPPPQPVSDAPPSTTALGITVSSGHGDYSPVDTTSRGLPTRCPGTPDTVSTNSKALDSTHSDSKAGWHTGELMDYRRLRQAFNDIPPMQPGQRDDESPDLLEREWRHAAREAGVPFDHAIALVSRAEQRDLRADIERYAQQRIAQQQQNQAEHEEWLRRQAGGSA